MAYKKGQDRRQMLTYVRTQISRIIKIPTCIATSWDDFEHESHE